jgi:uncharacterized protein YcbK (DUF882 family)
MKLTQHFSIEEMTKTKTGLFNEPQPGVVPRLYNTAIGMEKVRSLLGYPIFVDSGYRSEEVNARVGGSKNSDHIKGDACDFTCERFGSPLAICLEIKDSGIKYDQLIQEGTWVHISFGPRMRQETLTKHVDAKGETTYSRGLVNVA